MLAADRPTYEFGEFGGCEPALSMGGAPWYTKLWRCVWA
eukprot:SAG31_NODE_34940_length_327_cov_3.241228_1_plen_38_part_01